MTTFDVSLVNYRLDDIEEIAQTIADFFQDEPWTPGDIRDLPLVLCRDTDVRTAHYLQYKLGKFLGVEVKIVDHNTRKEAFVELTNVVLKYGIKDEHGHLATEDELVSCGIAKRSLGIVTTAECDEIEAERRSLSQPVTFETTKITKFQLAAIALAFAENHGLWHERACGKFIKALLTQ